VRARLILLVPNSLVVSRGCPHPCDLCYKDAFFLGGRSFYTQRVDRALAEIESMTGPLFRCGLVSESILWSVNGTSSYPLQ
jgi:hypothetical protein